MPRILVYEPDPVFAAVLEDRLHVAGFRVLMAEDSAEIAERSAEEGADLVVLEMNPSEGTGLEVVRELRRSSETRSLPIVALAESVASAQRVEALRAGVDDYLSKPFEVEELLLRLERLLGSRGVAPPLMQGDFENHPPWELIQYIQNGSKGGTLSYSGREGSGRLRLHRGRVVGGRFRHLEGREAVLAFLGMKEGRFRLADEGEAERPEAEAIPLQEVLMEAVWVEDELAHRSEHRPATGVPLEALTTEPPQVEDELAALPLAEMLGAVRAGRGTRLYDLIGELPVAPQKVRLAAALLIESGALTSTAESGERAALTTMEISSSLVVDLAVSNVLGAAKNAGFDTSALPYLALAEAGAWEDLASIFRDAPGTQGIPVLRKLAGQLERRRGGSALFETDLGKLSLHVQVLTDSARPQIEGIVPVCAGVLIWLDRGEQRSAAEEVIRRLEKARGAAVGALVAHTPEAREVAEELTRETRRWQVSQHAPRALVGLLRLLHPRMGGK